MSGKVKLAKPRRWKGGVLSNTYAAVHQRLQRKHPVFGRRCAAELVGLPSCVRPAEEHAAVKDQPGVYTPLCRKCHDVYDEPQRTMWTKHREKMLKVNAETMRKRRGEANPNVKITEAQVVEIRRRRQAGETGRTLAAEYRVSESLISCITTGKKRSGGWTLIETMLVVAIIGVLATIAMPLYAGVQRTARIAKARADTKILAEAVVVWSSHMQSMPTTLSQVTQATTNAQNYTIGPYIGRIPNPPAGWSAYTYSPSVSTMTFTITTSGDGTTVAAP